MNRRGKYARLPLLVAVLLLFALIPFALFRGSQVPEAEAAWWDNSWRYRKFIQVTNNTATQTNVYISLTLDTSDTTKFQDDCGDLRFTKQNGQVLPYYIVSGCGTASTSVHVQLDTFPSGDQTLFVYYGNLSAPNGSASNDFLMEATNYSIGGTGSEESAPGPAAYWKFDEGSGTTVFDSANYGLGDELLVDGDMEAADTSAWTPLGADLSKQTTDPYQGAKVLRVTGRGSTNPYARQSIITAGRRYRVTGRVRSDGTAIPSVDQDPYVSLWTGTNSTDWQEIDFEFVAGGTATGLRFYGANSTTAGLYSEYDNVSVREITSGNQGNITGATWATEDQCVSGKCLSFDGTDDYVDLGDKASISNLDTYLSVTLWVKATSAGGVIYRGGQAGSPWNHLLQIQDSSQLRVRTWASPGTDAGSGTSFTVSNLDLFNRWNHLVYTYDGATMKIYVNGQLKLETPYSTTIATGQPTWLGQYPSGGGEPYLSGLIDEVKIFPYALTEDEIKAEYNLGSAAVIGTGPTVPPPAGGTLSDSLVAHWAFDEQYGQSAHDKVGNNHGTLGASTSPGSDDPAWKPANECKVNGCLGFDRDERNYISSIKDLTISGDFSYSAWVMTDNPTIGHQGIVSNHYHSSPCYGVSLTIYSNGRFGVAAGDGEDNRPSSFFGPAVSPNSWYHVVAVYEEGTFSFYINGEKLSETWTTPVAQNNTDFVLGRWASSYSSYHFNGLIDEVKIYNTALTPEQVLQDMNAGASLTVGMGANEADEIIDGAGAPPIAEWKFDENQGTTAYDTSGNGNDGAVNGATWKSGCQQGACLEFDGVDDYVSTPLDFAAEQDITYNAWFKWDGATGFRTLFGSNANVNGTIRIDSSNGTTARLSIYWETTSSTQYGDKYLLEKDKWYFLSVIKTSNALQFYLDGQLVWEPTINNIALSDIKIGKQFNQADRDWNGQIDHVKIYDYARTPAQIAYDYNRGKPVAHWKFDECEGTVAHDSSGNDNHGTINIGASGSQSTAGTCQTSGAWANGKNGKFNGSLNFDGTDDYVNIPDAPDGSLDFGTGPMSISTWVKTTWAPVSNRPFIDKKTAYSNTSGYSLSIDSSGQPNFRIANGITQNNLAATGASINDGSWHHVLAVLKRGETDLKEIYVDGEFINSNTQDAGWNIDSTQPLDIGTYNGNTNPAYFFPGQIDDVRIYNYALSPAQILKVYNQGYSVRYGPRN